jgi:hypothetical protein
VILIPLLSLFSRASTLRRRARNSPRATSDTCKGLVAGFWRTRHHANLLSSVYFGSIPTLEHWVGRDVGDIVYSGRSYVRRASVIGSSADRASECSPGLEQPAVYGVARRLGARGDPQLTVDRTQVRLHGAAADEELLGHPDVGHP